MKVSTHKEKAPCLCCASWSYPAFFKKDILYFQCENCKTVFVPGGLPNDNMVGGGMEVERNTTQNYGRIERFLSLVGIAGRMLDFGCGHGMLVNDLGKAGLNSVGYDRYNHLYDRYPQGRFNLVSMVEVIEHLTYPFSELDVIYGLMTDNAILYVETSFVDLWDGPLKEVGYIEPSVGHCTIFSHQGLDLLMIRKGFKLSTHINQNVRLFQK